MTSRTPSAGSPEPPVAPQNLDAEERLLGAMTLAPGAADAARKIVSGSDFYRPSHRVIFEAIVALRDRDEPTEALLVINELTRRGTLEGAGGKVRVHELGALTPAASNAGHYARLVREAAVRREEFLLGQALIRSSQNGGLAEDSALLERTRQLTAAASASGGRTSRVRTYPELLEQYAQERSSEQGEPLRLGFGSLDAEIRGISSGQVLGVAARAAVGKTFFLNSVLETTAARRDVGSLTLSLEMPGPEWVERQLAIHADVASEQVEAWARQGIIAEQAAGFLERMRHAVLCDEPVALRDLPAVLAAARQRLTVPVRLVAIDYLGLLGAEGKDAYERMSSLGKGLKLFAKEADVAVVVAMQCSRAAGDGSEPVTIAMLRDSGVIEESADFLLGAWRPEKARDLEPEQAAEVRDVIRVAILKNRKGADGRVVDLRFRGRSRRIYEPIEVSA